MVNSTRLTVLLLLVIALAFGIWIERQNIAAVLGIPIYRVQPLSSFTENGVIVEIVSEKDQFGQRSLIAKFTPVEEHVHLYSKDLPKHGIEGLGRPTLLEIASTDGIKPTGPLTADQPPTDVYIEILDRTIPVYPDGAVTLRLPIELTAPGNRAFVPAELSVTYLACGPDGCLPPVIDKRMQVNLNNSIPY